MRAASRGKTNERSDVEGEEGEIVSERKGRNADRREKQRRRCRSQHGGRERDSVLNKAVDEKNGEGENQREDAERRDSDDGIHIAEKNQQKTHERREQVEKDALVREVGEEGTGPFDFTDEIDDGDLKSKVYKGHELLVCLFGLPRWLADKGR